MRTAHGWEVVGGLLGGADGDARQGVPEGGRAGQGRVVHDGDRGAAVVLAPQAGAEQAGAEQAGLLGAVVGQEAVRAGVAVPDEVEVSGRHRGTVSVSGAP